MNPIRHLRIDRGWTQAEAAERAGLTQQKWSRLELAPDIVGLQRKSLKAIRSAFGITWVDMALARFSLMEQFEVEADE